MSIFSCDICKDNYNENNKKPLSLPCGNIYCEDCIKKLYNNQSKSFLCPSHKIYHQFKLSNIPVCAQIYEYLKEHKQVLNYNNTNDCNNKEDELICCCRHPNNKIKFFCKNENFFLCSFCAKEHTEHNIFSIKIDRNKFKEEISDLKEKIEEKKEKFFQAKFENEKYTNRINNHIEEQIKKIKEYFSSIIYLFEEKKQEYINKFRDIQEKFHYNIELFKNNINQISDLFIEITKKITYSKNELYPKGEYEKFYQEKLIIDSLLLKISISEKNENFGFVYNQMDTIPFYNIPKEIYNKIANEEIDYFGKISEDLSVNNSINNLVLSEKIPKNKYLNMSPVDEKIIAEDEKTISNSVTNGNLNNNSRINLDNLTPSYVKDSLESTCYKKENLNVFNQNLMSELNCHNINKSLGKKKDKKLSNLKNEINYYYSPEKYNKETIISYSSSTNNITATFKHDITNEKRDKIFKPHLIKNPLVCNLNLKIRKDKFKDKEITKEREKNSSIRKFSFNTNSSITNANTKPTYKNVTTINTTEISNINNKNSKNNMKFNSNRNVSKTSRNKRFPSNSPEVTCMSNYQNEIKRRNKLKQFNPFSNLNNSNNSILKSKEIKRISSQIFKNKNKFKIRNNIRYKSPQDHKINHSSIFYCRDKRHNSYNRDGDKTIG